MCGFKRYCWRSRGKLLHCIDREWAIVHPVNFLSQCKWGDALCLVWKTITLYFGWNSHSPIHTSKICNVSLLSTKSSLSIPAIFWPNVNRGTISLYNCVQLIASHLSNFTMPPFSPLWTGLRLFLYCLHYCSFTLHGHRRLISPAFCFIPGVSCWFSLFFCMLKSWILWMVTIWNINSIFYNFLFTLGLLLCNSWVCDTKCLCILTDFFSKHFSHV